VVLVQKSRMDVARMVKCVWMRLPGAFGKAMENCIGSVMLDFGPVPFVSGLLASVAMFATDCLFEVQESIDCVYLAVWS
jgi:Ca2+/Na+ antiporter